MKVLSNPSSGKCANTVSYPGRYGQCLRQHVIPANRQTSARQHMRSSFGRLSRAWGSLLTEEEREAWNVAGPKVQSAKRLAQGGPLTGQQHFQGINSTRACLGLDILRMPPAPVVFGRNPVGQLVITNGDDGVRLLLRVTGPVAEDIMVFGQAPCSAGRTKRRNVAYLGLLPAPQNGERHQAGREGAHCHPPAEGWLGGVRSGDPAESSEVTGRPEAAATGADP